MVAVEMRNVNGKDERDEYSQVAAVSLWSLGLMLCVIYFYFFCELVILFGVVKLCCKC